MPLDRTMRAKKIYMCRCTFIIGMNFVRHKRKTLFMFRHFYLFFSLLFFFEVVFVSYSVESSPGFISFSVFLFFREDSNTVRYVICSVRLYNLIVSFFPNTQRNFYLSQYTIRNEKRKWSQLNWEIIVYEMFSLSIYKFIIYLFPFSVDNSKCIGWWCAYATVSIQIFEFENIISGILSFVFLSLYPTIPEWIGTSIWFALTTNNNRGQSFQ